MKSILLTGSAGFIGYKVAEQLLNIGYNIVGIDNLNDYYDVGLKKWRLEQLKKFSNFKFHNLDIENYKSLKTLFKKYSVSPFLRSSDSPFLSVINLAARAGVRYSMKNPFVYMTTNALGTLNLLELCREFNIKKFILASTSSLYAGQRMPFKESLAVNTPISPYASSKKSAESIAYTYHYLYGIDVIILRYFTVYGPAGRPDMSVYRFIQWIENGEPLILYGDGSQSRDFTYVDDIADGTIRAMNLKGFEIINLGNNKPHTMNELIRFIERYLGKKARIIKKPFFEADLKATWADITKAKRLLDWQPKTSFEKGIKLTVDWHKKNQHWLKDIQIDLSK